jgi:hypothetical protein
MSIAFKDSATYDGKTKTVISVRDGYQEYAGFEIGLEGEKYRLYRSPETIRKIAERMKGLPVTSGHVDTDREPTNVIGEIIDVEIVQVDQPETDTTLALKHKIKLYDSPDVYELLSDGVNELSLGYVAQTVEHDKYDFEQRDIRPHHLAVVEAGRCGGLCSFLDKGVKKMALDRYVDADGKANLQEIMEIINVLPDLVMKMELKDLQALYPKLMEAKVKAEESDPALKEEVEEKTEVKEETIEQVDEEQMDEDVIEKEEKFEKKEENFKDSAVFKDAVANMVKSKMEEYSQVREKAVSFLDESYDFAGKTPCDIMKDTLVAFYGSDHGFTDEEVPVAFKAMKKIDNYKKFGDAQTADAVWKEIGNKELN